MMHIGPVDLSEGTHHVREILREYLRWVNGRVNEELGINFDIEAKLDKDMKGLDRFQPPHCCLLQARE